MTAKKTTMQPINGRSLFAATALLLAAFACGRTDASGFGRCPKYPSMPKFNMTKVNMYIFLIRKQRRS